MTENEMDCSSKENDIFLAENSIDMFTKEICNSLKSLHSNGVHVSKIKSDYITSIIFAIQFFSDSLSNPGECNHVWCKASLNSQNQWVCKLCNDIK